MDLFLKDALLLYFYHWDLSGSGAVMTDRLTAGRDDYFDTDDIFGENELFRKSE